MGATRQILAEEWTGKARERDEAEGDARKLKKAILGECTQGCSFEADDAYMVELDQRAHGTR